MRRNIIQKWERTADGNKEDKIDEGDFEGAKSPARIIKQDEAVVDERLRMSKRFAGSAVTLFLM